VALTHLLYNVFDIILVLSDARLSFTTSENHYAINLG